MLPTDVSTAALDTTFVVALARPAKASLKGIVSDHRGEARSQLARCSDQDSCHGCAEVVIGNCGDESGKMSEGGDVSREKPRRVLPRTELGEVASGMHQSHEEEPGLLANTCEFHPDFEEVDLSKFPGLVNQRHRHLALGVAEGRDQSAHRSPADL